MSDALPLQPRQPPTPQVFEGRFVTLVPTDVAADASTLFALVDHTDIFRFMPCGPFVDLAGYEAFLRDWSSRGDVIAFTVHDAATKQIVGTNSMMSIRPEHGVAELGNIWYARGSQRTKVNTETCYLLLRYCFEELGYRRMEWKCDARNEPSRRAAERLGFTYEGLFRQHMIVKGENRDTAWFSITDAEWPVVSAAMRRWLYEDDSRSLSSLRASQS